MLATEQQPTAAAPRKSVAAEAPWLRNNPTSLWDMLRIYAKDFVVLMQKLGRLAQAVSSIENDVASKLNGTGISVQDAEVQRGICDRLWETVGPLLDDAEQACSRLELTYPVGSIQRIRGECSGKAYSLTELQISLKRLEELIEDQLSDRLILFVPTTRAKFLADGAPLFGASVLSKFPEVAGDIVDAGRCLGFNIPTGAVFYLMRVMELGIRRLAGLLGIEHGKIRGGTWNDVIKEINSAISSKANLGEQERAVRDRCAEASAHLNNVRIAWRNTVMHAERTYTQDEAMAIFENVKTFMDFLADKAF